MRILISLAATVLLSAQLAAQPVQQWSSLVYDIDNMKSITTDGDGNSFVCGDLDNGAFGWDIVTIKYSVDGDTIWKRRFDSDVHSNDYATKVLTDADGNCYVYGRSQNIFDFHPVLIKYAPSGSELFKIVYDGILIASASDMEIDDAIYIAMGYSGSILVKINFDGDTVWTRSYATGGIESAYTNRIAISDAGKIVTTGEYLGDFTGTYIDIFNQVCNTDGTGYDQFFYNGLLSDEDRGVDVVPGEDATMYITGYSLDTPSASPSYNMVVMKFLTSGDLVWETHYDKDPALNYNDYPLEILRSETGKLFVFTNSSYLTAEDYEIIAVNDFGGIEWVNPITLPGYIWDMDLYMDGIIISGINDGKPVIVHYNDAGETPFEIEIEEASGVNILTTDEDENIFVVYGVTTPLANTYLAKYADTIGVQIVTENQHQLIAFPNPCNEQIMIHAAEQAGKFTYVVSDMMGKAAMKGSINSSDGTLAIDTKKLDEGIYQITITGENRSGYSVFTVMR